MISGWGSLTPLTDLPFVLPALTRLFYRDQFCSLSFSLTNLYFIGCIYSSGFSAPNWDRRCNTKGPEWVIHFLLAGLPCFCRLAQSLRRWYDSRLGAHLINVSNPYLFGAKIRLTPASKGGKYASGILMYWFYYLWRHHGNSRGTTFAFYIVTATIYSIYACSWVCFTFVFASGFSPGRYEGFPSGLVYFKDQRQVPPTSR